MAKGGASHFTPFVESTSQDLVVYKIEILLRT